jgi:two-component system alkaline phosphatase synthesis response regulator PhoP
MNRTGTSTPRVLVAEDEAAIALSLEFLLGQAGYSVSVCSNGREALETALRWQPDLLILDVMLPEMNGLEVCRRIRTAATSHPARILMLTARARGTEFEALRIAGADDWMTKPFATRDLLERVAKLLRNAAA